jgi:hypothetical protein
MCAEVASAFKPGKRRCMHPSRQIRESVHKTSATCHTDSASQRPLGRDLRGLAAAWGGLTALRTTGRRVSCDHLPGCSAAASSTARPPPSPYRRGQRACDCYTNRSSHRSVFRSNHRRSCPRRAAAPRRSIGSVTTVTKVWEDGAEGPAARNGRQARYAPGCKSQRLSAPHRAEAEGAGVTRAVREGSWAFDLAGELAVVTPIHPDP